MQFRRLGHSDIEVSELGLGSWLTYAGGVDIDRARACTEAAFDVGINYFDTANTYGHGAAERVWGEILADHRRESYVLSTKVFGRMSPDDAGLSPHQIAKQIDGSLERLRTDYVDVYMAHRFDTTIPIEDTLEAFEKVRAQGKARYLGFSEWTPEQIQAAVEIVGPGVFVASQPQYSLLWQGPEAEVFPVCAELGISQVVWSPLAQGILTGKYAPGSEPPLGSRFASEQMSQFKYLIFSEQNLEAAQLLAPIARHAQVSLPTLALAWVLRRTEVASAITGASRPDQVIANATSSGVRLSEDILRAVDEALGDLPVRRTTLARTAMEGVLRRNSGSED